MEHAHAKRMLCILVLLCLLLCQTAHAATAMANHVSILPALDLTTDCQFTTDKPASFFRRLTDGDFLTAFESKDGSLIITAPKGHTIGTLYLCFAKIPRTLTISVPTNDAWHTLPTDEPKFAHTCISLPDVTALRIDTNGEALSLHELRVFTSGALPNDVQQWKPAPQKADLMLLVAHPDDEFIFFGGLLPYYASLGKHIAVVYMSCENDTRRSELLNGLWTAGIREYPIIGSFKDVSTRSLDSMYKTWTREDVDAFLIKLYRIHQPDVLVTHDINGEYGHGAHRVCADAAMRTFGKSADPLYLPQQTIAYGTWQVKKLYLHLYKDGAFTMDWTQPVGDVTAAHLADMSFGMHVSQQHFQSQNSPDARYSNRLFGLAQSTVGADLQKSDFFENIN